MVKWWLEFLWYWDSWEGQQLSSPGGIRSNRSGNNSHLPSVPPVPHVSPPKSSDLCCYWPTQTQNHLRSMSSTSQKGLVCPSICAYIIKRPSQNVKQDKTSSSHISLFPLSPQEDALKSTYPPIQIVNPSGLRRRALRGMHPHIRRANPSGLYSDIWSFWLESIISHTWDMPCVICSQCGNVQNQ